MNLTQIVHLLNLVLSFVPDSLRFGWVPDIIFGLVWMLLRVLGGIFGIGVFEDFTLFVD